MPHTPRPGDGLRAYAALVCSAKTMDRLIDPLVADLQTESMEAVRQGRVWKSRWVRMAGCVAFLKVIAFAAFEDSLRTLSARISDDDRPARRALGWAVSVTVVLTALLATWPLLNLPPLGTHLSHIDRAKLLFYLLPQALVVAVPIGIALGIQGALGGGTSARRTSGPILATALVCSVISLTSIAWIVPASNQAFRVTAAGRNVGKGFAELTLGEIGQRIVRAEAQGDVNGEPNSRQLSIAYHSRWAFSFATFVLTLFSLSIVRRRSAGRTIVVVAACALYFAYYLGPSDVTELSRVGSLPAFAIAWFPNLVLIVASALIAVRLKADATYESGSV